MENPFRPSIRKQFLDKIYQRNMQNQLKEAEGAKIPEKFEKFEEIEEKKENFEEFSPKIEKTSGIAQRRSATPGAGFKPRSQSPSNSQFFTFLNEILKVKGKVSKDIERKVLGVSRSLTEQFTKNSQFSLEFYIAMTGVLNCIQNNENIDCEELCEKTKNALAHIQGGFSGDEDLGKSENQEKKKQEISLNRRERNRSRGSEKNENLAKSESFEKNSLRVATEKLNLKVINTLKRVLCNNEDLINLFSSFLILFTEVEKDFEKLPLKKLQPSKIIELSQRYLQTPGKMIQLCRKFPDFIESHQISDPYIHLSEDFLTSVDQPSLNSLDRTGGILIFYTFLQSCLAFANSYSISMPIIPLLSSPSQETIEKSSIINMNLSQIEEDNDLNRELFKQSSGNLTPDNVIKNSNLGCHFQAKFEQFLKENQEMMLDSLENRILLYDKFERCVLGEVRDRFVPRIANLERFEEELSNL